MLTQKQKHAIRVREVLTGNNLFWLELSFPRERRASFAERNTWYCGCIDSTQVGETTAELLFPWSTARVYLTCFRTMKNYLQSSGVILLKDQEYENLDHVDGWLKFPYVSLCVVYFFLFFFLFSFLCDSWLGNGSSCFLEVAASSAGEKGGAYGSQDSHLVVSAQRKKETQTRETNGTEQYL